MLMRKNKQSLAGLLMSQLMYFIRALFLFLLIFPALLLQMNITIEVVRLQHYNVVPPGSAASHSYPILCHCASSARISEL